MLTKKTITYVDFDGEDKTEDFYFNLTKAELTELASDYPEGLDVYINRIVKEKDQYNLINLFKKIILKAYGEKINGKFLKVHDGAPVWEGFYASDAYSSLFVELSSDEKAAEDFFKAIVPKTDNVKN